MSGTCTIGVDYGTNSVRAVVVDCRRRPRRRHARVRLSERRPGRAARSEAAAPGAAESRRLHRGAARVGRRRAGGRRARSRVLARPRHRHRRRHDRLDAAAGRRAGAAAGARSALDETTSRRTRGCGRTTPSAAEAAAITDDREGARARTARADRRHLFVRMVVVEDLALPQGRAGRVRRGGELGRARRLRPGRARRRRRLDDRSSAASAPPATRRCTPRRGAGCRRRRSWRGSIRSSPTLRDRLYDKAWPPGRPAGRLERRVGARRSACAPGIADRDGRLRRALRRRRLRHAAPARW